MTQHGEHPFPQIPTDPPGHRTPPSGPAPSSYQPVAGGSGWSLAGSGTLPEQNQRNWAMASHAIPLVLMVLSAGTLSWVAPIITYALLKDRGQFVRGHAAEALNFQIVVAIGLAISGLLMLLLIGFITYPVIWVAAVVLHALAAAKAYRGEAYHYPMTPGLVR